MNEPMARVHKQIIFQQKRRAREVILSKRSLECYFPTILKSYFVANRKQEPTLLISERDFEIMLRTKKMLQECYKNVARMFII